MPIGSIIINKRALSLIEILIAVIILALVITGLANVFVASKRYIKHSRSRMTGGELGKNFLDPLQNDVNASTWSTTSRLGAGAVNPETISIDGTLYTGTYVVTQDSPQTNLNKVRVTISLPGDG